MKQNDLDTARGIINAVLISIPLWAILVGLVLWLF
jgi:hypothetical protein